MTQATNYKRSFSGSMGAGMKSVFGSTGRRFYELEFRTASEKHRAGETQKVIVDQIELGRDSQCGIRFGEDCKTVSRRHAAIIKDGNGWKLVQLSKTNSTYLNGRKVENEWYLQNGDEIQLSTDGPRIGFLVKEGAGSLVKSIGLTNRLSLFRQQALRPYKRALTLVASTLAAVVVAGTIVIVNQQQLIEDNTAQLQAALDANAKNEALIAEQQKLIENQDGILDSLKSLKPRVIIREKTVNSENGDGISECNPFVYHITAYWSFDGQDWEPLGYGTGFQLDDGKFVTARHVVSTFYSNDYVVVNGKFVPLTDDGRAIYEAVMLNTYQSQGDLKLKYECVSTTDRFTFTQDQVIDYGGNLDRSFAFSSRILCAKQIFEKDGKRDTVLLSIPAGTNIRIGAGGNKDWAYVQRNVTSGLKADFDRASSLKQGTNLYILGYPGGEGIRNPFLSTALVSQERLNEDGTILASNYNSKGGNSGGPVLIKSDNGWVVVAILSGSNPGVEKARYVPISVINR